MVSAPMGITAHPLNFILTEYHALSPASYEATRLKRELDRVIEERDRSRDECARAEASCRAVEQEFKVRRPVWTA